MYNIRMLRKKYIFANREDQIHEFPKQTNPNGPKQQHVSFLFKFYQYKRRLN